ncbi:MAG: Do family serine endopeptidase [Saprospiraceae bacterium]
MRHYLSLLLVALLSAFLAVVLFSQLYKPYTVVWEQDDAQPRQTNFVDQLLQTRNNAAFLSAAPNHFIDAAELSTPTVANIRALQRAGGGVWGGGTITSSSGSGVLISPDGYVVTNHHVVEDSDDIRVTLADKRQFKARIVGIDPHTDIALLKIDARNLPFIVFGNSDSIRVGEWVLAVGNPFNLESTVTAGIVSAKGRNINILGGGASIESFIQTDAAVNQGNSGGALVNTAGELIGINTAIITESGSYEGYSFAVPSNLVKKVINDLREFGEVQRAFLGVGIEDVDDQMARDLRLANVAGVYITHVNPGSAADDAGLRSGDVIVGLNQSAIKRTPELQEYIGRFRPGDQIEVEFIRNGKRQNKLLRLKDRNNSIARQSYTGSELQEELGLKFRNLSEAEKKRLQLQGVAVTEITRGSVIDQINMKTGFVVTSINNNRINNVSEAIQAIKNAYNSVMLDGYYEGDNDLYSYRFRKHD